MRFPSFGAPWAETFQSLLLREFRLLGRRTAFKRYSTYFLAHAAHKTRCSAVTAAQPTAPAMIEEPPAVQAALATLSWPALCEFVARFASTTMGRQAVQRLSLSQDQEHSEALVKETSAVDKLESEYAVELDFGGTSTSQVRALYGWRGKEPGGRGLQYANGVYGGFAP